MRLNYLNTDVRSVNVQIFRARQTNVPSNWELWRQFKFGYAWCGDSTNQRILGFSCHPNHIVVMSVSAYIHAKTSCELEFYLLHFIVHIKWLDLLFIETEKRSTKSDSVKFMGKNTGWWLRRNCFVRLSQSAVKWRDLNGRKLALNLKLTKWMAKRNEFRKKNKNF